MEVPNPLASLAREQVNQFIDIDLEPEVDLEFKVYSFEFMAIAREALEDGRASTGNRDRQIEAWLNDGWQLDNQIICPPFVMLIFSREKETTNNE